MDANRLYEGLCYAQIEAENHPQNSVTLVLKSNGIRQYVRTTRHGSLLFSVRTGAFHVQFIVDNLKDYRVLDNGNLLVRDIQGSPLFIDASQISDWNVLVNF